MSWQAFVDTSLVATGHIDKGAIISAAGDSVWATSPGFDLKPDEMKTLSLLAASNSAAKDKVFAEGLYIGGERFVVARADDDQIYARSGRTGVAISPSKAAIVVGHHPDTGVAGNATSVVVALAQHLKSTGY